MAAAKKKAKAKAVKPVAKRALKPGEAAKHIGGDKLTPELKRLVVTELACFKGLSEVVDMLKEEHGIEITRQSVQHYDPTSAAGRNDLSKELTTLFFDVRKAYREDTANVLITGKAARIRKLEKLAEKAEQMGNIALAREILEQIAKEMGEAYTNVRKIDGKLGVEGAVAFKPDLSALTDEQLDALERITGAVGNEPKRQGRH